MTRRLIIQALAEDDITQAAIWYRGQRLGLEEEFIAAVDAALERVVANARQFPCLRRRLEVRRVITRRFPYRIFFVVQPDAVVVFRVLHGAREDREWKGRLPEG
jgi:plasmid stabilization system protein ParE